MRFDRLLLCTCLALPASLAALSSRDAAAQSQPTAADRAQARTSFQEGVAAYTRGEYGAALTSFQTAYRLAPHPSVRVNMANCYVQLHQPVEALSHFEQFIVESPTAPAAQRTQVERQIADLRRQLGEVRIRVGPDSAMNPLVLVDGNPVTISGPVRLSPGHHAVEVSADGYTRERREFDVTAGGRADVELRLQAAAAAASTSAATTTVAGSASGGATNLGASAGTSGATSSSGATEPPPSNTTGSSPDVSAASTPAVSATATVTPPPQSTVDRPRRRGLPPGPFIATAVVTGVAGVVALGCGIGALGANGTFESAARRIANNEGDLATEERRGRDAASTARTLAAVTDVSLAVAGVAAITSIVLLTQTRFSEPAVTVAPIASAHGGGLAVGGRF